MRTLGVWLVLLLVAATTSAGKQRMFLPRCDFDLAVEGCSCHVTRNGAAIIGCIDLGLAEFPDFTGFPSDMTIDHMDLSGNGFGNVPENAFRHLVIRQLVISRTTSVNGLRFHPECLRVEQRDSLVMLDVSYNSLSNVPDFISRGLSSLEELVLSGNIIDRVSAEDFAALQNLLSLHLGTVGGIEDGALTHFPGLELLELSPSEHSPEIYLDDFIGHENLRQLSGLVGITVKDNIFLWSNSFLGTFDNLIYLEIINSGLVTPDIDQPLSGERGNEILLINLSENYMKSIPRDLLSSTPNLEYMDMTGNRIKKIQSSAFAANQYLVTLSLGSNRINNIEAGAFASLSYLEELDLSDNNLGSIQYSDFPSGHFYQGMTLYLGGNSWECNCNLWWLMDLAFKQHHGGPGPLAPYEIANSLECESPSPTELMYIKYESFVGICMSLHP